MVCPECGAKTRVVNSRACRHEVLRKRSCPSCGRVMYTFESEDETGYARMMLHQEQYAQRLRAASGEGKEAHDV